MTNCSRVTSLAAALAAGFTLMIAVDGGLSESASARDFRSAVGISAQSGSGTFAAGGNQRISGGGATRDAELSMVQLQSVVSQRQIAVQTTQGMMKSINESNKAIIKN